MGLEKKPHNPATVEKSGTVDGDPLIIEGELKANLIVATGVKIGGVNLPTLIDNTEGGTSGLLGSCPSSDVMYKHTSGADPHTGYIKHSLATAVNDFLVASGVGVFVKKTLAEVKTILGLGSAAYTASTDYAVSSKGVTNGDSHDHNGGDGAQVDHGGLGGLGDDDHTQYIKHALSTAANDLLFGSGSNTYIKKTLAESIAILLGAAIGENVSVILTHPSVDGKWCGITEAGVAGATLAFGDLVYLQTSDHRWELASANDAAAGCNLKLGICVLAADNDGSATNVLLYGKVRGDTAFPDLTLGAPAYMSTTAGDITATAPSGSTDIIRVVGHGDIDKDTLFFNPSQDWFEHA